jgi:hypothetical protein
MIKANELRIGNLIHIGWDDVEVTAIEEDGTLDTTAYFDGFKGCCGRLQMKPRKSTANLFPSFPKSLVIQPKVYF